MYTQSSQLTFTIRVKKNKNPITPHTHTHTNTHTESPLWPIIFYYSISFVTYSFEYKNLSYLAMS